MIMQTQQLGQTDMQFTRIGLGTWAMGGPWLYGWGPQDDGEAVSAVRTALEKGINWIDTAPIYGLGHSEELVGKALKQTTQKPLIATKCGLLWSEQNQRIPCLEAKSIREECHTSLKKLHFREVYQRFKLSNRLFSGFVHSKNNLPGW